MNRILIYVLTLLVASCQHKEIPSPPEEVFFNATLPEGIKQTWTTGDQISVISLNNGQVSTVDTFTAKEDGGTARFAGIYTGAGNAPLAVIWPAVASTSDKIYESTPLNGNDAGYFRVTKGTGYVLFAPADKMQFLQKSNEDTGAQEGLCFLSESSTSDRLFDEGLSLRSRTSMLKLVLETGNVKADERMHSVRLSLDKGTPFTTYRGSLSLSNPGEKWSSGEPRSSYEMILGDFSVPEGSMTLYIPVFQNNSDASLSGSTDRKLTVTVITGDKQYVIEKTIPGGDPSYAFRPGGEVVISGTLSEGGDIPPQPEGPAVTNITKVLSSSISAVCIEGNYLYAGAKGIITVLDITNPKSPREVGAVNFPGSARQMVPSNGKLYVSARETGVWIFNIATPSAPSLISRYDGIELSTGIDAAGDAIFVGERQTGVEFVDGRNPSKAEHIRVIKTPESQTVFYQDGYLYSGEWASGQVSIFDAKNLSDIRLIKTINLQGMGDGLWVTGNRLYASTGHHHRNETPSTQNGDGHGVEIWDVTNPEDPKFISRSEFDIFYQSGADWWLPRPSGDGKTLFCGDVYNGLYVLDISDETHPEIIYHWKPGEGHAVNSVALADGVAYVAVGSEGLYAMESKRSKPSPRSRGTLPTHPEARYSYTTPSGSHFNAWIPDRRGAVKSAVVYQDALFVGCGNAGLYTVKLNSSGLPYTFRRLDIPFAGGVAIKGNLLFVSRGEAGLGVYRIGNDLNLTQIDLIKSGLRPDSVADQFSYWVTVPNDYYVVNGARSNGYHFLSIGGTNDAPTFSFKRQYSLNLNYNRYISEKTCPNGLLPYATRSGLVWINLGNAASVPTPVVYSDIKNSLTEGCTLYKDGKVLLTKHNGNSYYLATIEPGGSAVTAESNANAAFEGIPRWESGDNVLICKFTSKVVSKVNTANFSACTLVFKEETAGYPEPGLFWNGKCVVPCGYQGLLIEK